MNLRTQVAQLIRELRIEAGMTQSDLARKLGCGHSRISLIEDAKRGIGLEDIEQIAEALNLDIQITVTWKKEPVVRKIDV
ncbi:MAG: helix-turn-helix domain-containing protein [Pseudanabaena sp.]|jgi:transcriptional regulator with XRE-family HTH domain